MGANPRTKGQNGEREVIGLLQPVVNELYGVHSLDIPRLQRNTLQSDGGGCDIVGLTWLALEVKFHAKLEPAKTEAWWRQTVEQAGKDKVPVLIYKKNYGPWHVRMEGVLMCCGVRGHISAVVTVDIETFLAWFRNRVWWELGDKQHGL